jgi:uncharacterized protein (DUF427 family)
MKATLNGKVVAASDDIVENGGYHYFPLAAVRMDWLKKVPKTPSDHACPHGVQFYDVVIDGTRAARAAWAYEAPRPSKSETANRIGFWQEVVVG